MLQIHRLLKFVAYWVFNDRQHQMFKTAYSRFMEVSVRKSGGSERQSQIMKFDYINNTNLVAWLTVFEEKGIPV